MNNDRDENRTKTKTRDDRVQGKCWLPICLPKAEFVLPCLLSFSPRLSAIWTCSKYRHGDVFINKCRGLRNHSSFFLLLHYFAVQFSEN